MKLNARYVSIGDFDDLYFQVSFENQHPAADYDPSAPTEPYLLLQRQFEDDDGGVCYLETHDTDRFAGHFRLRLIEFTPTRLAFEIDRPEDRTIEVTHKLSTRFSRSRFTQRHSATATAFDSGRKGATANPSRNLFRRPMAAMVGKRNAQAAEDANDYEHDQEIPDHHFLANMQ